MVDVLDHHPDEDLFYVSSAYGDSADWVRNIRANPVFEVQVGKRRFEAEARKLEGDAAEEMLMRYIDDHRNYVIGIYRMIGVDLDTVSEDELRSLLRKEMVLAIKPIKKLQPPELKA